MHTNQFDHWVDIESTSWDVFCCVFGLMGMVQGPYQLSRGFWVALTSAMASMDKNAPQQSPVCFQKQTHECNKKTWESTHEVKQHKEKTNITTHDVSWSKVANNFETSGRGWSALVQDMSASHHFFPGLLRCRGLQGGVENPWNVKNSWHFQTYF